MTKPRSAHGTVMMPSMTKSLHHREGKERREHREESRVEWKGRSPSPASQAHLSIESERTGLKVGGEHLTERVAEHEDG
jgi:hypothetical protein